jgi:hypothetical protein
MIDCKQCGHKEMGGPDDCACECHAHSVDHYEPRQIMPAAPGWRAVYKGDDGPITEPVVMWAVCFKTEQWFLRNGRPARR